MYQWRVKIHICHMSQEAGSGKHTVLYTRAKGGDCVHVYAWFVFIHSHRKGEGRECGDKKQTHMWLVTPHRNAIQAQNLWFGYLYMILNYPIKSRTFICQLD